MKLVLRNLLILGRMVRRNDWVIEYKAGSRHRRLVLGHFEFDGGTFGLSVNESAERCVVGDDYEVKLSPKEAISFRTVTPGFDYLA